MDLRKSYLALSKFEKGLWFTSLVVVVISYFAGNSFYLPALIASLTGVTALIFVAKGDVLGQILTIVFSLLYAWVSLQFRYYGEMITYLGMSAPSALLAVISWLRHPFEGNAHEVSIAKLTRKQIIWGIVLSVAATALFGVVLFAFDTPNLLFSIISVTTSFLASYLTICRSPLYALAYSANDVVLIILWVLASVEDPAYMPMILCFVMFLCNDLYGYCNWRRISIRQQKK